MHFAVNTQTSPVVCAGHNKYYNNTGETTAPAIGKLYYGQAAFHLGNVPSYTDNDNGTITDNVTGLM